MQVNTLQLNKNKVLIKGKKIFLRLSIHIFTNIQTVLLDKQTNTKKTPLKRSEAL